MTCYYVFTGDGRARIVPIVYTMKAKWKSQKHWNVEIGQPRPQNCLGYCPECPNLFDCGTPKMVKKYMRHRKDGKHAKGLNLSCDNCGMGIDYKHFEGKNPKWIV